MEYAELEVRSLRGDAGPELVSLRPLVREALRTVEAEAGKKGLLVVERFKEDLPPVLLRRQRFLRAFQNVLDNAVKFANQGGQIVIEAELSGGYVRIDVADDGPGIPLAEIESVLREFRS